MQLSFREVAAILNVSEDTVYHWIAEKQLPTRLVNSQYRFNRVQLFEWATRHSVEISPNTFARFGDQQTESICLEAALRVGGVLADLNGDDAAAVVRQALQSLPLSEAFDRENLVGLIVSKTGLRAMAIGHGVAVPRPRTPIIIPGCRPAISLCYLAKPLGVETGDQQPIHTLFLLISPTVRAHLQLLARLAFASCDVPFRELLARRAPAAEIFSHAARIEEEFRHRGLGSDGSINGNAGSNGSANVPAGSHEMFDKKALV